MLTKKDHLMNLDRATHLGQIVTYQDHINAVISMIMKSKFRMNRIGDYILGNVMTENCKALTNDVAYVFVNHNSEFKILNQKDKDTLKLWLAYFEFFFPPEENIVITPELFRAIQPKIHNEVHFFFQRARPKNRLDNKWCFFTSRLCLPEGGNDSSILFHYAIELNKSGFGIKSIEEESYTQKNHARFMLLSSREKELIKMIVEGKSSSDIANILFLSIHTVNNHRKNIIRKLQISSLCQLTKFAISFNII